VLKIQGNVSGLRAKSVHFVGYLPLGYHGAEPTQQASGPTVFSEAAERLAIRATSDYYGQAGQLRCRKEGDHGTCRTSTTQGFKQPSGTLASADEATGAHDAALQISRTGPTVSLRFWTYPGSLSAQTIPSHCSGLSCAYARPLPRLERSDQWANCRLTTNHPPQSSASFLPFFLLLKKLFYSLGKLTISFTFLVEELDQVHLFRSGGQLLLKRRMGQTDQRVGPLGRRHTF
jgi:hypothetical protein